MAAAVNCEAISDWCRRLAIVSFGLIASEPARPEVSRSASCDMRLCTLAYASLFWAEGWPIGRFWSIALFWADIRSSNWFWNPICPAGICSSDLPCSNAFLEPPRPPSMDVGWDPKWKLLWFIAGNWSGRKKEDWGQEKEPVTSWFCMSWLFLAKEPVWGSRAACMIKSLDRWVYQTSLNRVFS